MYDLNRRDQPIVQKYGGTSVGTAERIFAVAQRCSDFYQQGFEKIALVLSAQAGETNRLIRLLHEINPDPPDHAYDVAVAAGEQVSIALMAAALDRLGMRAQPLLAHQLGIYTDELHTRARVKSIDAHKLEEIWQSRRIPVIAGFQGISASGEITTLGRGGSDTSAVAIAVAAGAQFCEINTDVDGLFSADPRFVPKARLIETCDPEVALEMASMGSEVLHPRCVELAHKWRMPLVLRNSFQGNHHPRTIIMSQSHLGDIESPVVTGVSSDKDVLKVTVKGIPQATSFVSDLFEEVSRAGVNVDIIVYDQKPEHDEGRLGFSAAEADRSRIEQALGRIAERYTKENISYEIQGEQAKVSIVGVGMRSHSGVAQRAFAAISRCGADIKMISTSEIKVSCVIPRNLCDQVAQELHAEFIEGASSQEGAPLR